MLVWMTRHGAKPTTEALLHVQSRISCSPWLWTSQRHLVDQGKLQDLLITEVAYQVLPVPSDGDCYLLLDQHSPQPSDFLLFSILSPLFPIQEWSAEWARKSTEKSSFPTNSLTPDATVSVGRPNRPVWAGTKYRLHIPMGGGPNVIRRVDIWEDRLHCPARGPFPIQQGSHCAFAEKVSNSNLSPFVTQVTSWESKSTMPRHP